MILCYIMLYYIILDLYYAILYHYIILHYSLFARIKFVRDNQGWMLISKAVPKDFAPGTKTLRQAQVSGTRIK